jgi:Uma2 family endonuclease
MTTALLRRPKKRTFEFGLESNGTLMTPEEFDRAEFDERYRYELVNGVLIVSPLASIQEADPNDQLGYWLRRYQEEHPKGSALDLTVPERHVVTKKNRRRADRLIWAGLGRMPRKKEAPTIVAEFVTRRKRDRTRDYETKLDEYMAIKVQEYWIIDRFDRCLVVFRKVSGKVVKRVLRETQVYRTPLLPGFELDVGRLLAIADRCAGVEEENENGDDL